MGVAELEPETYLALLSEGDRAVLLTLGRPRRFGRGERLMRQGEPGDAVMVLLTGHVKVGHTDARGHEHVLAFRGPGDVLGESTVMHGEPRPSSETALEPVEARVVAAVEFRRFVRGTPSAALALIDDLSRRFRDANILLRQFGDLDTGGRLAARLVELSGRYGEPTEGGIRITLPLTQEDLGGCTSSSRAGVTAALRTMRELGWIATERRRVTVLDLAALTARAA